MALELQFDSMWVDDREYKKGDLVEIEDEERREELVEMGALADEGTLEEKANQRFQLDHEETRRQRVAVGLGEDQLQSDKGFDEQEDEKEPYEDKSTAHFEESEADKDEKKDRSRPGHTRRSSTHPEKEDKGDNGPTDEKSADSKSKDSNENPATTSTGRTAPAGRGRR